MPNPLTVPIVGSNFDSVGGQLYNWAGMNNQVDSANISRANAAEQNQNNYFDRISQLARQDAEADLREKAYAFGIKRQDEQENRRRFEFGQGRTDALTENARTWDFRNKQFGERDAERKRSLEAGDEAGEFLKKSFKEAGDAFDEAEGSLTDATRSHATRLDEEMSKLPAGVAVYNRFTKRLDPEKTLTALLADDKTKPDAEKVIEKINQANSNISSATAELESAKNQWSAIASRFDTLKKDAFQYGLLGEKVDGKWTLKNPQTKKTFAFTPQRQTITHYPRFNSFDEARAGGYDTGNTITTADGSNAVIPALPTATAPSAGYSFGGATAPAATPQVATGIKTVATQSEYDALPSGAAYINARTGRRAIKP